MRATKTARKSRAMPMPPDFPAIAPMMELSELAARYGCSERVVRRWSRESGADYKGRSRMIPPPDDFREIAPLHTHNELRRIYGRSGSVIVRWAQEAGVTLKRVRQSYVKRDAAAEITICLSCKAPQCRYGKCAKIGR